MEAKMFRQKANPSAYGAIANRSPQQMGFAAGRLDQREQHLHRRRFACTIGSEKPEYLTFSDGKRQAFHRKRRPDLLTKRLRLDNALTHRTESVIASAISMD